MAKCYLCQKELPEPGTNFYAVVSALRGTIEAPCCIGCMKSHKEELLHIVIVPRND